MGAQSYNGRNEKYIVFKREEWDDYMLSSRPRTPPEEVEDGVVIRRQDVFAPPALDAYCNSIIAALSLRGAANLEQRQRLQEIADYFHEQAAIAWDADRKIPD